MLKFMRHVGSGSCRNLKAVEKIKVAREKYSPVTKGSNVWDVFTRMVVAVICEIMPATHNVRLLKLYTSAIKMPQSS
ncbi:hypothetical protein ZEAMMB73_Zm00001d031226 [Zea mays]|uniref:Uncharacterized protein n=1 Tax=Zea mays TaxID=4577 RepID=A0A1D6KH05_MAIZE|nr:hypothetical protein ZEAMMB73_Zm00001d031226 [Zea mays]